MPIYKTIEENDVKIVVWKTTENKEVLLKLYKALEKDLLIDMTISNDQNLCNSLASRLALNEVFQLSGNKSDVSKDEFGKLHVNEDAKHVSVSHCDGWACAIVSALNVGIDIEKIGDRVSRIRNKFCSREELLKANDSNQTLHYIWGAKESMYKAYGRKQITFSTEMSVDYDSELGELKKNGVTFNYSIFKNNVSDNVLMIYCIQS